MTAPPNGNFTQYSGRIPSLPATSSPGLLFLKSWATVSTSRDIQAAIAGIRNLISPTATIFLKSSDKFPKTISTTTFLENFNLRDEIYSKISGMEHDVDLLDLDHGDGSRNVFESVRM